MTRSSTPALRFLAAAALSLAAGAATADTLTVGGTGAALGTLRLLAAEFTKAAPMNSVRVVPNLGGGGSMKALAAGAIDLAAVEYIEKTPGAIGVTSLAVVRGEQRNVNVLPLGGVAPSPRSVADGSYPYAKPTMLVRKGAATPAVARFFEFIASAKGRQILADAGHWVADAPAHR